MAGMEEVAGTCQDCRLERGNDVPKQTTASLVSNDATVQDKRCLKSTCLQLECLAQRHSSGGNGLGRIPGRRVHRRGRDEQGLSKWGGVLLWHVSDTWQGHWFLPFITLITKII